MLAVLGDRGLDDPEHRVRVKAGLEDVKERLGEPGASRRAAEAIMAALHR